MQNLMCSAKGWLIQRRRYGKQFHEELERYRTGYYNQEKELVDFLDAVKDVEAYKGMINNEDIDLCRKEKGYVYQLISKLPIIGKTEVKSHIKDYFNTDFSGEKIEMRTSGTTGSGLIWRTSNGRFGGAIGEGWDCLWTPGADGSEERRSSRLTTRKPPFGGSTSQESR